MINNLIGNNSRIEHNIRGLLFFEQILNMEITECKTILEKTKKFKYIVEKIFISEKKIIFIYNNHWFLLFGAFLTFIRENNLGILLQELDTFLSIENKPIRINFEYTNNSKILTFNNIINLFRLYFAKKKWCINGYMIYEIIPNTTFSVKCVKNIKHIEELYEDIVNCMLKNHFTTFFHFDFVSLKLSYLKKLSEIFVTAPETIAQVINITFDIIEFKNGIYFILSDNFLKTRSAVFNIENTKNEILDILKNSKVKTTNYYKRTYKHKKTPLYWIQLIEKKVIDPLKIPTLFRIFTKYFNRKLLQESKKHTLAICFNEVSNTLKIALITRLLIKCFSNSQATNSEINAILDSILHDKQFGHNLYNQFPDIVIYCNKLFGKKNKKNMRTLLKALKNNNINKVITNIDCKNISQ